MEDARDLIERLFTLAGAIMEDSSETALVHSSLPADARAEAITAAGQDLIAIAAITRIIARRGGC